MKNTFAKYIAPGHTSQGIMKEYQTSFIENCKPFVILTLVQVSSDVLYSWVEEWGKGRGVVLEIHFALLVESYNIPNGKCKKILCSMWQVL